MKRAATGDNRLLTTYERIYAAVRRIPRGRVATYGQIATVAGLGRQPRLVGYALNSLADGDRTPWHRVINARGGISPRGESWYPEYQRRLLEDEGVEFDSRGRVGLERYQWRPRSFPGR